LISKKVGDLLILGLLYGALVALISRAHEFLLDEVDTYVETDVLALISTRGELSRD
jgi:hypothetical protein